MIICTWPRSSAEFLYNTLAHPRLPPAPGLEEGVAAKGNGFLEDYAYLAEGLLALYQTTFDTHWFAWALELVELIMLHFHDVENGGFYDTSDDHEGLSTGPNM